MAPGLGNVVLHPGIDTNQLPLEALHRKQPFNVVHGTRAYGQLPGGVADAVHTATFVHGLAVQTQTMPPLGKDYTLMLNLWSRWDWRDSKYDLRSV